MLQTILTHTPDVLETITGLGTAGLMGAMWLWERQTSRQRDQQLDAAHARVLADKVALDQLIHVVQQNAEALARLSATQEALLRGLGPKEAA